MYTVYAGAAGMLLHINEKFTMGKLNSSSVWGQFSYHLWEIVTGNDVTGSRELETGNEREIISRVFLPGISRLFLPGISRVFPGTPVDSRHRPITPYVKPFSPPDLCNQS